jgi:hypothetical protein
MAKTGEGHQEAARKVRAQVGAPGAGSDTSVGPALQGHDAYYDESGTWFPLRRDGLWLDASDWKRNLLGLRRRTVGTDALAALKTVFTPEWSQAQRGTTGLHPIVYDGLTIGGRHRLLELGAMLSVSNVSKRTRERLLLAEEYLGIRAELHVALLLRAAKAQYKAEPVKGSVGPDGLAEWETGTLSVEIKRPHESALAKATQQVELDFFNEFSSVISLPSLDVDTGVWLTLHVNASEWPRTVTGARDAAGIRRLARDVAGTVRSQLTLPTRPMQFPAGPGVRVSVQLGLADEPRVQLGMYSQRTDSEHEAKRLFSTLQEAAKQLAVVHNVPGLIVLDADGDLGILNHIEQIKAALAEEWARSLAGVAIVTKDSSADEQIGDARLDTVIRIVPGPLASVLSSTLLTGVRVCERGHFHVDPLLRPGSVCRSI